MDRTMKEAQVDEIRNSLENVEGLVLTSVKGLDMGEVSDLRKRLREANVNYRVMKNTLVMKAIEGTDLDVIKGDLKGETALAWSSVDPVTPAKIIINFKKDCEKFVVKSGYNSGQRLDEAAVVALSKLPSMEELRARLLGVLQAVPAKLMAQINAPAQNIVGVIQAKADKDKEAA